MASEEREGTDAVILLLNKELLPLPPDIAQAIENAGVGRIVLAHPIERKGDPKAVAGGGWQVASKGRGKRRER